MRSGRASARGREEFRRKGLEFNVHTDAAWAGYLQTTIRTDFAAP